MAIYYFIRHGEADFSEANTKIYQGHGCHMITLSEAGKKQIKAASRDPRLREAEIIITSPYGRALHSAAILSKELGLDICVETDLHEWMADGVNYSYLTQKEAEICRQELTKNHGNHPCEKAPAWESAAQMKERVFAVLEKYKNRHCAIVCCHGILMQYVLEIPHPSNGKIEKYEFCSNGKCFVSPGG